MELLIVVAIIGILAAVGLPTYQGYLASAKVSAAKENHARISSLVAAELTKCALGSSSAKTGILYGANDYLACPPKSPTATQLADWLRASNGLFDAMYYAGFRNPHQPDGAVTDTFTYYVNATPGAMPADNLTTAVPGMMYARADVDATSGARSIRMKTFVSEPDGSGVHETITSTIGVE